MKDAIYLGKMENWKSDARLYRLTDPPFHAGKRKRGYVVISGADLCVSTGRPDEYFQDNSIDRYETYIFRSTRKGACLSWMELPGSFSGTIDHDSALSNLGYETVNQINGCLF